MPIQTLQVFVFVAITVLIAWLTYRRCVRDIGDRSMMSSRDDVFLAGRGLSWIVVAGSITLTNLST
ncbi:MAG: SLC5 family protein, partial [Luminiphilus sp.]|nr:SLC5 family protein [Luminiphilus sp.]